LTFYLPTDALVDLNNAINLSEGKGHVARQAFCQRGLIYLIKTGEKEGFEHIIRIYMKCQSN
jgi:hypothetical protein